MAYRDEDRDDTACITRVTAPIGFLHRLSPMRTQTKKIFCENLPPTSFSDHVVSQRLQRYHFQSINQP
jgi:hypothetical protein